MKVVASFLRFAYVLYLGFANHVVTYFPFNAFRVFLFRHVYRITIGKGVSVGMGTIFRQPHRIRIGDRTTIRRRCFLDGRRRLNIGCDVILSPHVVVLSGIDGHDVASLGDSVRPVVIEDRVCIMTHATVAQCDVVGKGALVGAGSVVRGDVPAHVIVAGNPAVKVGQRTGDSGEKYC